ncbi:MAG TPA: RAMP superfamily CRISPR-associated protein [Chloroflexota bacterium]|nr:RAMP superfamily CRISPR-associated protein [Chloroflexota bacterium]
MSAMRPAGPPRAPKPYGYVPLGDGTVARRDPLFTQGHDRQVPGALSGHLAGRLVALTPLHVGASTVERTARILPTLAAETPLLFPLARAGETPVLPGTTLKGALRSIVEAITASCLTVRGPATRLLPPPLHALRPCTRRDALCPACRLFGGQGYLGRLRVADASLAEGSTSIARVPERHPPRAGRGAPPPGRRFYGHGRPASGPLPVEVFPEGSALAWRIDCANLQPAELGLLLLALGQGEPPLRLKLGGYKPTCFGSAEFIVTSLVLDEPATRWLRYEPARFATPAPDDGASAGNAPDLHGYLEAALDSGLVLRDRLDRLAGILRYPSGRDCPAEGY